jgi:ElaB/YqjD/DUF883 family membrane-anchored ribosome-binding protein
MSEASKDLEAASGGDVPTADETLAATAREVGEAARNARRALESNVRRDPLRGVFIAAGVGFLAAVLAKRI